MKEEESRVIDMFLTHCVIVEINDNIRKIYKHLRKTYRLKLGDAVVAATAIFLDIPLMSSDKDFNKVKELYLMYYTP